MKRLTIPLFAFFLLSYSQTFAESFIPHSTDPIIEAGNYLQYAIPVSAIIFALAMQDWEGSLQWLESNGATLVSTQVLKLLVKERRPDGGSLDSFPSGHTSAAFAGAAFWQMRYGWAVGIPMYALAAFTGYSRIYGDKHFIQDVLFGAALGIGFNLLFTSQYMPENMNIWFSPIPNGGQVNFSMKF